MSIIQHSGSLEEILGSLRQDQSNNIHDIHILKYTPIDRYDTGRLGGTLRDYKIRKLHVETEEFSDITASEFLQQISHNPPEYLYLDFSIDSESLEALIRIIREPRVKRLYLRHGELVPDALDRISSVLHRSNLEQLYIFRSHFRGDVVKLFEVLATKETKLRVLGINCYSRISNDQARFIAEYLPSTKLEYLALSCSPMPIGLSTICSAIARTQSLKYLSLEGYYGHDENSVEGICEMIKNSKLVSLKLGESNIGGIHLEKIAEAIKKCPTLKEISFADSLHIQDRDVRLFLEKVGFETSLKKIDFSRCNIRASTRDLVAKYMEIVNDLTVYSLTLLIADHNNGVGGRTTLPVDIVRILGRTLGRSGSRLGNFGYYDNVDVYEGDTFLEDE